MRLWHYTAPTASHLGSILRTGVIRATESNLDLRVANAGPPVAWFLDGPLEPGEDHGLVAGSWKTEAAVVVDLPEETVERWTTWAPAQPAYHALSVTALVRAGGGTAAARRWVVHEGPVRLAGTLVRVEVGPPGAVQRFWPDVWTGKVPVEVA